MDTLSFCGMPLKEIEQAARLHQLFATVHFEGEGRWLQITHWLTITINVIAALYYCHWFGRICQNNAESFWKWAKEAANPRRQGVAGRISRLTLHTRLSTDLLNASVKVLTLLRLALIVALFWRWWRLRLKLCSEPATAGQR